jgi:hypothetical protein
MFRFKFLLVSCLIFNLSKWSDGKTLNCSSGKEWYGFKNCYFDHAELNSSEEASFVVANLQPGETLANITELNFRYSSIYYIPASIFTYFTKLRWLRLVDCSIQEIGNNTFENATVLQNIYLNGNKISALQADTFRGATSLNSINLQSNQISHIDPNAFRGLPNLHYLDLSSNKITEVDGRIFAPLGKLYSLGLSNNSIRAFDKDTFRSLSNLGYLSLSQNLLETLDETLFLNNPRLSSLDLSHNKIWVLNSSMFQHLTELNWLNLMGNICVNDWIRFLYLYYDRPNPAKDEILLVKCNNNYVYKRTGGICHRILKYFPSWVYDWAQLSG